MEKLITIEELADHLGVTLGRIYVWRTRGQAPPAIKVGRRLMFKPSEVEKWHERNTSTRTTGNGNTQLVA